MRPLVAFFLLLAWSTELICSSPRFEKAFINLIEEEKGYVNDPDDRGGETNYGISKRSYPYVDIKNLTLEQAADIYERDFYKPMLCHRYTDDAVAVEVLEQAVNMGKRTVTYFLQVSAVAYGCKINIDGKMGRMTLAAVNSMPPKILLHNLRSLAIAFYLNLAKEKPPMKKYLNGWIKRVQT